MATSDHLVSKVTDLLFSAALTRRIEPEASPWDYGWYDERYRRSGRAAAHSPDGPVVFSEEGIGAIETAMDALIADRRVRNAWADEDLWQLTVSAVSSLALSLNDAAMRSPIAARVTRLVLPGTTVVTFAIANSTWQGPPLRIGEAVLGGVGQDWLAAAKELTPGGRFLDADCVAEWLAEIE